MLGQLSLVTSLAGNAKSLAAFSATSSQYATTIGTGHTLTESVLISSFPVRRLESPFHDRNVLTLNFFQPLVLRAAKIIH
jgi:hypothetical protein